VRFENFFTNIPVCSASRASFLTGRIPSQHGVHDFVLGGPHSEAYLDDEICYTDVLSEHGWTCGLSGKWHLGNSARPQHGFSHWFAHPHGAGPYNDHVMIRNGVAVVQPGYITNAITDDALAFIDAHAADDSPFYLRRFASTVRSLAATAPSLEAHSGSRGAASSTNYAMLTYAW